MRCLVACGPAGVPGAGGPGRCVCRWAAARPRAVRAASFARRVASKPGQAPPPPTGTAAGPSGALHTGGACGSGVPGQALPPPTGNAAGPSGTLHTSRAWCADGWLAALSRCPADYWCCLWPHGCFGRRRARPPARLGGLTSFGAAPRRPPVPSGPSGTLHTGGAWCAGVWLGAPARCPARPRHCLINFACNSLGCVSWFEV